MVKTNLLLFLGLFFSYELFLRVGLVNKDWLMSGQSIWSTNIIRAQSLLYDEKPAHYNCIIGSSIVGTLDKEQLPKPLTLLSLSGLSVYDGLFVLNKRDQLPDTLFVETNVLERSINANFCDKIGRSTLEVGVKGRLLSLRETSAPLNLLAQVTTSTLTYLKTKYFKDAQPSQGNEGLKEFEINNRSQTQVKTSAHIVDDFLDDLNKLKKQTVVVLFDMPVDCRLSQSDAYYEELYDKARQMGFLVVPRVNCAKYRTSDGIHLDHESSKLYTRYFVSQMQGL